MVNATISITDKSAEEVLEVLHRIAEQIEQGRRRGTAGRIGGHYEYELTGVGQRS